MIRQHTLQQAVWTDGVGLHTGEHVALTLRPAPVDTGIVFRRCDLPNAPPVPARVAHVESTYLATTLVAGSARVVTVEHLLAALFGLGVDNVYVDVNAAELPIMDGSAAPFVRLIESAGVLEQEAPRQFLRIRRRVEWTDGDVRVSLTPYDGCRISYRLYYEHPVMLSQPQQASVELAGPTFAREVAGARTFGFLRDFEQLRARGLARGCSFDNVVVVGEQDILNDGELRIHDELVKHKILDAIGDLSLLGTRLIGAFEGYRSGHTSNCALLKRLLGEPDAFEYVSLASDETVIPSWQPAG